MRKEYEQFKTSTVLEGMTSIRALLHAKDAGVNTRSIKQVLYDISKYDKLKKDLLYIQAEAKKYGFEVSETDADQIDLLAIGNTHGGLIALCGERQLPSLAECTEQIKTQGFYAMIEGIEDPYNFGYALRSLYACGVDGIILGERNWMSAAGVVARASAGASEELPLFTASPTDTADIFHSLSYTVVAADLRTEHELGTTPLQLPLLLIAGGEKRGISRTVLDKADLTIKIPYSGSFRGSLSAASAVTMFAYEIMRQNR
jgi:23S rRNA (guanosine2251-2'-O)-methyltransferase